MQDTQKQPREPVITVFRKVSPSGNRCWYYSDSRPHEMSERLAIKDAARGKVRLKTIET